MALPVRATYRVQLTPRFTIDDAAAIVPYLAELGISHVYTSPLGEATPGSPHGYDVTDHQRVRAELGGPDALTRLWEVLDRHDMGHVVDLVPNHMGIRHESNRWWQELLAEGQASRFAGHFDIDWITDDPATTGKVVLPFLDRPLDDAIAEGVVTVERRDDSPELVVRHHGDHWPASRASTDLLRLSGTDRDERTPGALERLNDDPERLRRFLDAQHWRAVHWRDTPTSLNWRRFFDITDLAGVRVEVPEVFDDVHALLRSWLDDPLGARVVQGVRVDHVDGLVDPRGYLTHLREVIGPDRLLVVEKILAADETLPSDWPVDGTTGYEVTARITEAMTWGPGAERLAGSYASQTGSTAGWPDHELAARELVVQLLAPEVRQAAFALHAAVETTGEPPPDAALATDLVRGLACELDVYRTYPAPVGGEASEDDRLRVERAARRLARRRADLPGRLVALTTALLTRRAGRGPEADAFVRRFSQLTAPLAAKAVEDTAFYRYPPCSWLNEVGGDPGRRDVDVAEIHRCFSTVAARNPGTLVPLTTHDTKRSGDVRARLGRLAERPSRFTAVLQRWDATLYHAPNVDDSLRWLLWQGLIGAWPVDTDRARIYTRKAMREAKVITSWLDPVPGSERQVHEFVDRVVGDDETRRTVEEFVVAIRGAGRVASLAQVALAATVGTPDVYQGDELWNLALVDPDNRRPVDYALRRSLLRQALHLDGAALADLWKATRDEPADDGLVKLAVLHRLLQLRAPDGPLRADAPYAPLDVQGEDASAVVAFTRGDVAVVVPRRTLDPILAGVELPPGRWSDVLADVERPGGTQAVADLVEQLPVAVLRRP